MNLPFAETVHGVRRVGRSAWLRSAARWRGSIRRWLVALALLFFCALPGSAAEDQLRIIRGGVYPPFTYRDATGAMVGFEVDIADALCAVLVVRCVATDVSFEQMIPALLAGRGDVIIASLSITEERKKLVAFTNRYYRTPMQFIARRGFDRPITRDGLRGLRIGVTAGGTDEVYARNNFSGAATIVPLAGDENILNHALIEGQVDLLLGDSLAMWPFITSTQGRDFAFVGEPIYVDQDIGIAVRKQDEALRQRLNAAIARIRLDGTYQKINAKYFPFSIY
jgi:ABC-type amino acid transport substrate-binding protein